jgi:hypothetical protein
MKKLLLIAAVTIASGSAYASKARLSALQSPQHIDDIQRIYIDQPERIVNYEAATVEFGGQGTTSPSAEGGFIRKMGDSAYSLYLGRPSTTYQGLVDAIAGTNAALQAGHTQQNALTFGYGSKMGDINWGATLLYIGNDYKTTQTFGSGGVQYTATGVKQNVMGVLLGATNGVWDVQLRQGLGGETKTSGISGVAGVAALTGATSLNVKSTQSTKLRGGYNMDSMYFYGAYTMAAGEAKNQSAKLADLESTELQLGVINSHKKDGVDFFYGAEIISSMAKNKVGAGTQVDTTNVPVFVGVEGDVASWLVLRGGLRQSLNILSQTKTKGSSATDLTDNTTTTFGAGFKFGKAIVDVTMGMGSTGSFGFDSGTTAAPTGNFANASMTYTF